MKYSTATIVIIVGVVVFASVAATLPVILIRKQKNNEVSGSAFVASSHTLDNTVDTENPYTLAEHQIGPPLTTPHSMSSKYINIDSQVGWSLIHASARTTAAKRTRILGTFRRKDSNQTALSLWQRGDSGPKSWDELFRNQHITDSAIADLSANTTKITYVTPSSGVSIIQLATYTDGDETTSGVVSSSSTVASPNANTSSITQLVCDTADDDIFYVLDDTELWEYSGGWTLIDDTCYNFHQNGDWMSVTGTTSTKIYKRASGGPWAEDTSKVITYSGYTPQDTWVTYDGRHVIISSVGTDYTAHTRKRVYRWSRGEWKFTYKHPHKYDGSEGKLNAHIFEEGGSLFWSTDIYASFHHFGKPTEEQVDFITPYSTPYGITGTVDTYDGKKYYIMVMYSSSTDKVIGTGIGSRLGTYYRPLAIQ